MELIIRDLTVGYGRKAVLTDVNVRLGSGRLTMLLGANGSGKSTLLRTIIGSQQALRGVITLDGNDLSRLSAAQRARLLSVVLTERTGGGGLRVDELVAIGRHPYSGVFGRLNAEDRRIVAESISAVGLSDKAASAVASLSDGERQKAMIARALAQQTPLIVLDEPTSFLDISARFEVMDLLARLVRERGTTVLMSIHDVGASLPVADDLWAIAGGRLYAGAKQDLIEAGVLDGVYDNARFDALINDFRRR